MDNELNPHIVSIPMGDLSGDATIPACYIPKKSKLLGAYLQNGAALNASDTDFVQLTLKDSDDNEYAELDTRAAHEGALTAHVAKPMNIVEEIIPAGTSLKLVHNETDADTNVALTDAIVTLHFFPY